MNSALPWDRERRSTSTKAISTGIAIAVHVLILGAVLFGRGSGQASGRGAPSLASTSDSAAIGGLPTTRARNYIAVRVIDAVTGTPLEGAAVRELSMESPARTGASGTVNVAVRPAARAEARVTRDGYEGTLVRLPNLQREGTVVTVALRARAR